MYGMRRAAAENGFYGAPADVWSVGVLIFALLTGCAPFDDSDFHTLRIDVLRNHINYPAYISDQVKEDSAEYNLIANNEVELTNAEAKDNWSYATRNDNVEISCRSLLCRTSGSDCTYSSDPSLEGASKRRSSTTTNVLNVENDACEGIHFFNSDSLGHFNKLSYR
ncbi:unnamed protein product [Peronospora belbahrii]|uniref:Protein kinase domain-containing protein n=1 Tax=Peronospora belbahrii TaxID=622444 RepID=A0ABN8D653_9STRA|nr:unnamed protein product [Peronospora belbahrii]